MVVVTRSTAKAKHGLESRLPQLQKAHEHSRQVIHPAILQPVRPGRKESKHQRRTRLRRMRDSILGPSPTFPGKVIVPEYDHARLEDITRLQDIEGLLQSGTAQVYWINGFDRDGFLGAGVVWLENGRFESRGHHLGPNTVGSSGDTEVFAIAAALGRAKKYVQRGNTLALVRVFSDCSGVLDGISKGNCHALGPMLVKKTALEGIYARARWLQMHDVPVELV